MKVLIDALPHKSGGGITYIENLVPELARSNKNIEYYILVQKNLDIDFDLTENCKLVSVLIPFNNILIRMLYEQLILPIKLYTGKFDLLFSPADTTVLLSPVKVILAIRNISPYANNILETNWGIRKKIRINILKIFSKLSVMKSKKVIFVSDFSKNEISKQLGIPKSKATTVYHGIKKEIFAEIKNESIPDHLKEKLDKIGNYILSVSSIYSFKNYTALLKAYSKLEKDLRDKYNIIIAGKILEQQHYKTLQNLAYKLEINDKVHFLGKVEHKFIPYLYSKATVFVHPSFLETFGHSLVESMAAGIPVIAANSPAIPEILGGAGLLFDAHNPDDLTKKITSVLKDKNLREELTLKGLDRANNFSWEKSANETLQVLINVYNKRE
jgi:glycosyltransferase involved in cell wall biosynthesis